MCLDIGFQQGKRPSLQDPSKCIGVRARTCGDLGSSLSSATSFHATWVQPLHLWLLQAHESETTLTLTSSCAEACVGKGITDDQEVLGIPDTWGCTASLGVSSYPQKSLGKGVITPQHHYSLFIDLWDFIASSWGTSGQSHRAGQAPSSHTVFEEGYPASCLPRHSSWWTRGSFSTPSTIYSSVTLRYMSYSQILRFQQNKTERQVKVAVTACESRDRVFANTQCISKSQWVRGYRFTTAPPLTRALLMYKGLAVQKGTRHLQLTQDPPDSRSSLPTSLYPSPHLDKQCPQSATQKGLERRAGKLLQLSHWRR